MATFTEKWANCEVSAHGAIGVHVMDSRCSLFCVVVLGFVGIFTASVRCIVRNIREGRGRKLHTRLRNSRNSRKNLGIVVLPS